MSFTTFLILWVGVFVVAVYVKLIVEIHREGR